MYIPTVPLLAGETTVCLNLILGLIYHTFTYFSSTHTNFSLTHTYFSSVKVSYVRQCSTPGMLPPPTWNLSSKDNSPVHSHLSNWEDPNPPYTAIPSITRMKSLTQKDNTQDGQKDKRTTLKPVPNEWHTDPANWRVQFLDQCGASIH